MEDHKGIVKCNGTIVGVQGRLFFKPEGIEEFVPISMGDFLDEGPRVKHVGEDCLKPVDIHQHIADVRQAMEDFSSIVERQMKVADNPVIKPRHNRPKRDWEQRNRKQRR